ncbi:MAG: hypothetical protein WDN67_01090 [Candidatus Moraniibacteriota bacterium]
MHETAYSEAPEEESWAAPSYAPTESDDASEGQLTIDVYQTENDIVIKSTIAGVNPKTSTLPSTTTW